MNWWPRNQDNVLSERATAAERRLKAIKQVSSHYDSCHKYMIFRSVFRQILIILYVILRLEKIGENVLMNL